MWPRGSWQTRIDHLLLLALLALPLPAAADAWESFRGNPDNSGFADVKTIPAKRAPVTVPDIGTFAAGAGPITGPDGAVYLGNEQGRIIALRADGTPYWNRQLPTGQAIVASPALGPSGTLYVVSIYKFTDHRLSPPQQRARSTLWRFSPGGGDLGPVLFPTHGDENATVLAPPNILSFEGGEFVVVPALYRLWDRVELRVLVFSAQGIVVADALAVTRMIDGDVSAELRWCLFFCIDFVHGSLSRTPPLPGVAIFRYAGGGDPWIVFSDSQYEIIGYTFTSGTLEERYRVVQRGRDWRMRSAPVVLPEGRTLVAYEEYEVQYGTYHVGKMRGGVVFAGPAAPPPETTGLGAIYGSPTRLADGRVLLVSYIPGDLVVLSDGQVSRRAGPRAFAAAAASATHVFISTWDAFITLDSGTLNEVARIPWFGGGEQPPAIGPQGHVYALASNVLFVFPAPRRVEGEAEEPEGPIVPQ